jgi:hypothetical protein
LLIADHAFSWAGGLSNWKNSESMSFSGDGMVFARRSSAECFMRSRLCTTGWFNFGCIYIAKDFSANERLAAW